MKRSTAGSRNKQDQVRAFRPEKKTKTLIAVSGKYGIETVRLKQTSGLKKKRPNMRLRLTAHREKDRKEIRTATYHLVKKGETISGIAVR